MPNQAKVESVTGPGRSVKLTINDIEKINVDLKRRVVEITDKHGEMTEYDIANSKGIRVTNTGGNFVLEVRPNQF